mmetsp:Transcript_40730/g.80958  ORF Transcript_40730/g.80958 Transcript_40730/m.80958 type:complete len:257 (+) Transcript_40730:220-990(+)
MRQLDLQHLRRDDLRPRPRACGPPRRQHLHQAPGGQARPQEAAARDTGPRPLPRPERKRCALELLQVLAGVLLEESRPDGGDRAALRRGPAPVLALDLVAVVRLVGRWRVLARHRLRLPGPLARLSGPARRGGLRLRDPRGGREPDRPATLIGLYPWLARGARLPRAAAGRGDAQVRDAWRQQNAARCAPPPVGDTGVVDVMARHRFQQPGVLERAGRRRPLKVRARPPGAVLLVPRLHPRAPRRVGLRSSVRPRH